MALFKFEIIINIWGVCSKITTAVDDRTRLLSQGLRVHARKEQVCPVRGGVTLLATLHLPILLPGSMTAGAGR